jgi:hypothetical protein
MDIVMLVVNKKNKEIAKSKKNVFIIPVMSHFKSRKAFGAPDEMKENKNDAILLIINFFCALRKEFFLLTIFQRVAPHSNSSILLSIAFYFRFQKQFISSSRAPFMQLRN